MSLAFGVSHFMTLLRSCSDDVEEARDSFRFLPQRVSACPASRPIASILIWGSRFSVVASSFSDASGTRAKAKSLNHREHGEHGDKQIRSCGGDDSRVPSRAHAQTPKTLLRVLCVLRGSVFWSLNA